MLVLDAYMQYKFQGVLQIPCKFITDNPNSFLIKFKNQLYKRINNTYKSMG